MLAERSVTRSRLKGRDGSKLVAETERKPIPTMPPRTWSGARPKCTNISTVIPETRQLYPGPESRKPFANTDNTPITPGLPGPGSPLCCVRGDELRGCFVNRSRLKSRDGSWLVATTENANTADAAPDLIRRLPTPAYFIKPKRTKNSPDDSIAAAGTVITQAATMVMKCALRTSIRRFCSSRFRTGRSGFLLTLCFFT